MSFANGFASVCSLKASERETCWLLVSEQAAAIVIRVHTHIVHVHVHVINTWKYVQITIGIHHLSYASYEKLANLLGIYFINNLSSLTTVRPQLVYRVNSRVKSSYRVVQS